MKEQPCWDLLVSLRGDLRSMERPDVPGHVAMRLTVHNAPKQMAKEICALVAATFMPGVQWGLAQNDQCESCIDLSGRARSVDIFTPRPPASTHPERTE